MLYAVDTQLVPSATVLNFTASQINSTDGSITASGTDGVTLTAGQYLVNFVSDASVTEAGTIGAALALNGAALPYASSALTATGTDGDRIAITAIVNIASNGTLTVVNNSGNEVSYENSTLTVVKLA